MTFRRNLEAMHLSRRRMLQGAAAAGALTAMPRFARAQSTDWMHTADISQMPETKIRYWYYESPERVELGKKQVADFEKLHPNIKIDGREAPQAVDNEQLLSFIRTGTNSHIQQTVNNEDTWYIRHDLERALEDLPGFQDIWNRLNPSFNYTWKDGHVYSLSWYASPMTMVYNKTMVVAAGLDPEKPPTTYTEYLGWAKALTKEGQWFISLPIGEEWWWYEFVMYPFYIAATGNNQLLDPDGTKAIFNTPEAVKAYELFGELFSNGYSAKGPFEGDPFTSGVLATTLGFDNTFRNIRDNAPDGFEYIVGPVPKPDDATHEGNPTYQFVRSFSLMREQEKKGEEQDRINRAAWEFLSYLLTPEQMAADFAASGSFPAAADLTSNPIYKDALDSLGAGALWAADYGLTQGQIYDMNSPYEDDIMAILQKSWVKVAQGDASPQDAVTQAEKDTNDLLANPPA